MEEFSYAEVRSEKDAGRSPIKRGFLTLVRFFQVTKETYTRQPKKANREIMTIVLNPEMNSKSASPMSFLIRFGFVNLSAQ